MKNTSEDKNTNNNKKNNTNNNKVIILRGCALILAIVLCIVFICVLNNKSDKSSDSDESYEDICPVEGCNNTCLPDKYVCKEHELLNRLYSKEKIYQYSEDDYATPTPSPTANGYSKRKSNSSNKTSRSYGYPSNPKDYSDAEDYYYDNEEDFDGLDDAESYYDEYGD